MYRSSVHNAERNQASQLARKLEPTRHPLVPGESEEALFGEKQAEGGAEGAPGRLAQVRDPEIHPAGAFAARGGDEAERGPVEKQAGGNPGAAEEALRAAVGRGFGARPTLGAGTGASAPGPRGRASRCVRGRRCR